MNKRIRKKHKDKRRRLMLKRWKSLRALTSSQIAAFHTQAARRWTLLAEYIIPRLDPSPEHFSIRDGEIKSTWKYLHKGIPPFISEDDRKWKYTGESCPTCSGRMISRWGKIVAIFCEHQECGYTEGTVNESV